MKFSVSHLFHKHTEVDAGPTEMTATIDHVSAEESAEELEREEFSEVKSLYQHLSTLYSRCRHIYEHLYELTHTSAHGRSDYMHTVLTYSKDARANLSMVLDDSAKIRETSMLLKRKLMQHHVLHEDSELLHVQHESFNAMSNIRLHIHRVEEILSLVDITMTEFLGSSTQSGLIAEMKELAMQVHQSVQIVARLIEHVSVLIQIERDVKHVEIENIVHKDIVLERKDIEKLSGIFNHTYTMFSTLSQHYTLEGLQPDTITKDYFYPYVSCLQKKILPTLQQCMKYEEALFRAASEVDATTRADDQSQIVASQKEIRLFTANIRQIYRDINTQLFQNLRQANSALSTLRTATSDLDQVNARATLQRSISTGIDTINEISKKLAYLRDNTASLYHYMMMQQAKETPDEA